VSATGGKYFYDDDQEFPDTQYVSFEYHDADGKHPKQLIYEHRIWSPYVQEGYENGNAYYGTKGMLLLGKLVGWKLFGPRNKLIDSMDAGGMGDPHYQNFIDSLRSGKLPNADIEIGHYSAALSHLANIATRLKTTLTFDPDNEKFVGNDQANALVSREYRQDHWAVPKGV
ncbi:MAG: gfo/Idh/MocA family oxidoreductase, partial [Planctomycetaceae bacterium]|nr:gfo/Idh/MocA family oxidoreductase [Planctomycetaceae bacterium]